MRDTFCTDRYQHIEACTLSPQHTKRKKRAFEGVRVQAAAVEKTLADAALTPPLVSPPALAFAAPAAGLDCPTAISPAFSALASTVDETAVPTVTSHLSRILRPEDVATLSVQELEELASELRRFMISSVSCTGGHLAPSLGVVELTLAMLSVFNPAKDKFVWDVGHQAYAYKILTGRADRFHTLRQFGGISGFPNMKESPYDHYGTGHSSTSVSAALGMAQARDIAGEDHHVISVIGDGSLTGGLAYEGLNQAGATTKRFIVILNDNEMSIAKNVGALSLFMSRNLSSRWVRRVKREVESFLMSVPGIGEELTEIARRSKHSFKNFFTPGILFEALRFNYIGAVDGHNIQELQKHLQLAAALDRPVLIHVLTRKGKGYAPAENNPVRFHGVGCFEPETGGQVANSKGAPAPPSHTKVFGDTLTRMAEQDKRIIAITAAMPEGTGLTDFAERFPDRFVDVGICEQHAVVLAAGLATQGLKPVVAIYSTFLQRAYDQIVHDVCTQNLPVTFCLDRAGIAGQDGATHQGAFDLAYLRHIPNITIFAPKDAAELQQGLATAFACNTPFAMRYPRGAAVGAVLTEPPAPLPVGEGEFLQTGDGSLAVVALGNRVMPALDAAERLQQETGIHPTVFNARWIKPLPERQLSDIINSHKQVLIVEEGCLPGGFSSAVIEFWSDQGLLQGQRVCRMGLPDAFVEHGPAETLRQMVGIDADGILQKMRDMLF